MKTLTKAKRKRIIKSILVDRAIVKRIWGLIDKCRDRAKYEPEPRCLLITGITGVGKTQILNKYLTKNPSYGKPGAIVRPVIYVKMPKNRSLKTLARRMLRALESPLAKLKVDRDTLFDYAYEQIGLQGVEVVLLDEMQHLTETGADASLRKAADDFKDLAKDKNTPLVMAGLDNAIRLLEKNEQLERLCCYRETVRNFRIDTPEGQKEFSQFLKEVDDRLPFEKHAKIGQEKLVKKIFRATKGHMSFVMLLIREAAFTAIDRDEDLEEKHFHEAFDDVMKEHLKGTKNPFDGG